MAAALPFAFLMQLAGVAGLGAGELRDALVLGPKWADAPRVRVAPMAVELDCRDAARRDVAAVESCAFEVRVEITTRDPRAAIGAFYVGGARDVVVTVDGVPVVVGPDVPPELERFETGFRGPSFVAPDEADPERAIPFVIPAVTGDGGRRHTVVVRGRVWLEARVHTLPERVGSADGVTARHPVLSVPARRRSAGVVLVAPVRGIDGVRTPEGLLHHGVATARAPSAWTLEGRGDRACPLAATGLGACGTPDVLERTTNGDRVRVGYASPLGTHLVLGARASTPPESTLLTHGGPAVGAGYAFGLRDGFRARLAYDVGLGASGSFVGSVGAETDARRRLELAPVVLVATRAALLRPSFGVGVGAPVAILPDPGVSGRLRLDAKWTGVGLSVDVDVHVVPVVGATTSIFADIGL